MLAAIKTCLPSAPLAQERFGNFSYNVPYNRTLVSRLTPLIVATLVVVGDRLSKLEIQHALSSYDSIPIVAGWLRIIHTENPGAAFGMLAEGNPILRSLVLIGVSSLVLLFVAWALWSHRSTLNSWLSRLGLSLILGGAFGNLYDRVVHQTVTDFIEVYHRGWSFPAFNVADSAITIGAILLLLDLWRQDPKTYGDSASLTQHYSPVKRR
jgi:signal peptidase II